MELAWREECWIKFCMKFTCSELQISTRPPSKREISEVIKAMKREKDAGVVKISAETLLIGPRLTD
jgi:hypothetical protein